MVEDCILTDLAIHNNDIGWGGNTDQQGYFETDVSVSHPHNEYQVYRKFGIEMRETCFVDKDGEEIVFDSDEYYDLSEEERDKIDKDGAWDYGREVRWLCEWMQVWVNVYTGKTFVFMATDNNDSVAGAEDNQLRLYTKDVFVGLGYGLHNGYGLVPHTVMGQCTAGYYHFDLEVHEELRRLGYKGFSGFDADYDDFRDGMNIVWEWRAVHNKEYQFITRFAPKIYADRCRETSDKFISALYTALRIAHKNHYNIEDDIMYIDYIQNLVELGKGVNNTYYACPADLKAAHDKWLAEVEKVRSATAAKREEENIRRNERAYYERIGKYLNCKVSTDELDIFVCPSVKEMFNESCIMKHCVYRNRYYAKENALIILIRDKWNASIATTEIHLSKWNIVQTQGLLNHEPYFNGEPYRDKINELITNDLIPQLKQASKKVARIIPLNTNNTAEQPTQVALAA